MPSVTGHTNCTSPEEQCEDSSAQVCCRMRGDADGDHQRGLGDLFALLQHVLVLAYTSCFTELTDGVTLTDPSRGAVLTFRDIVAHCVMMTGLKADGTDRSADVNPSTCVPESCAAWMSDDGRFHT